jgi:hypothetical protein
MPPKVKKAKPPGQPDPQAVEGKAALDAFAGRRDAIPRESVRTPNLDVESCAIFVMGVARKVNDPALSARFESLPEAEFDIAHVRDLGQLALGTWYATIELASASATSTEAKLPAALVQRATERKTRMLKVVVYHFEDHPMLGPEVADIILGTGYRDMASDLPRLAKVYANERATVEKDPKHYRADDEAEALKNARAILEHLSEARSSAERMWADVVARSWTLMSQSYNEVSAAGSWLLRHEGGAVMFLPLVVAARLGRAKPKKKGAPDEGTEGEEEETEEGGETEEG